MKKSFVFFFAVLAALTVSRARAEAAPDVSRATAQAEAALWQSLDGIPILGEGDPIPDDLYLCGPFLYLAPTRSDSDEVFIPDQNSWDYEPQGIPQGAEIRAEEVLLPTGSVPESGRAVFPLLFSPGYSDSATYVEIGSVNRQSFAVLLIDRETGEVAARVYSSQTEKMPIWIMGGTRKDMNDHNVLSFTPRDRKSIWDYVLGTAPINGYAFFMEDGEVTGMLRYAGGELVIPEGAKGIGKETFREWTDITAVRFPDSLTYIGECAFADCTGLKRAEMNEGLGELYSDCFSGCTQLEEVRLPASLYKMGERCFQGCTSLSQITVPEKVSEIPESCFSGCTALESVEITGMISKIGKAAFEDCGVLRTLTFPDQTDSVGVAAFWGCDSLESISFGVTRRYAEQNWDKAWDDGCNAEIRWKRDPLPPILGAVEAAIVLTAAAVVIVRKKRAKKGPHAS